MVLRNLISATLAAVMLRGSVSPAIAEGTMTGQTIIEDFTMQPQSRWRFFTDQLMGGVSTGRIAFAQQDGASFALMTGHVSTTNRGGFIQMRLDLPTQPPAGTTGVRLIERGNARRYFLHLHTHGTLLPGQYYQAGFDVTVSWNERASRWMHSKPRARCCATY